MATSLIVNQGSVSYDPGTGIPDFRAVFAGGRDRIFQTFTMPDSFNSIDYIKIYLGQEAGGSSTVTMRIYATLGGVPTGGSLAGPISLNSGISDFPRFSWETFNFTDFKLTPGTKYAIVLYSSDEIFNWGLKDTNPYSGGNVGWSYDTGSSWYSFPTEDHAFQIYGYLDVDPATVTTTSPATNIDVTTADVAGEVTDDGDGTVSERGIVASSVSSTPTTAHAKYPSGSGTGAFSSSLYGLPPGKTIYSRAYAINEAGTSYGAVVSFTTLATTPTVLTSGVSSIASITANGLGEVTANGGASVTTRGICWDTSVNPEITDDKIACGVGNGEFTGSITGLSASTTYHVRAYATNSEGTSYGADVEFTTLDIVKYWAQSFTAGETGVLNKVSLYLRLAQGTSGNVKLRIYSDDSDPDTLLETISTKVITNGSYAWIDFICNTDITDTNVYWLVLEDNFVADKQHLYWGANSAGGYADGAVKYAKQSAPSSWINTDYITHDTAFKTYVQPDPAVELYTKISYRRQYK